MIETFTKTHSHCKTTTNVQYQDSIEGLEIDEQLFYGSISDELDQLMRNPKMDTVSYLLDYSKALR